MKKLERMKKQVHISKLKTSQMEQKYKIEERKVEIERMEENVKEQQSHINELELELAEEGE